MLAGLTLYLILQVQFARPFPDVPANHWAYEAVNTLKEAGLLRGYPDGRFRG